MELSYTRGTQRSNHTDQIKTPEKGIVTLFSFLSFFSYFVGCHWSVGSHRFPKTCMLLPVKQCIDHSSSEKLLLEVDGN